MNDHPEGPSLEPSSVREASPKEARTVEKQREWPKEFYATDIDTVARLVRLQPETGPAVRAAFDAFDRLITPAMLVDPDVQAARATLGSAVGATLGRFAQLCAHARMVAEDAESPVVPPAASGQQGAIGMRGQPDTYISRDTQ